MASQLWSKSVKQKHDPVHFLMRRGILPEQRQTANLLRRRISLAQDLHWKDLKGHFGCVNAIEFSNGAGELIASGGDDRRVLVWQVEKMLSDIGTPSMMSGEHNSNIFCIAFDLHNRTIFSGGNDEQVVVHDINTGQTKDVFPHGDAVYGLSADPTNSSVFASACDDGRLLIYDTRDSTVEPFCVANYTSSMHSVMYNPIEPRLLATANSKEGVGLWDVRKPKSCILRYGGGYVAQSCMSVRFNQHGDQIIALRRRLPPVLYKIHSPMPVCEFDHTGYYNSCTMKSISFAGDNDQYVLSGSDDFNLYMWAIPDDLSERLYINSAHLVLRGHRSIVNQVRFNPANHLIISSGVEKIVKVWSPFCLPSTTPSVGKDLFKERPVYSHEDYINLILRDGNMMTHDYTEASTEEDPRMIAFFDSLVQRELEGWSSDDTLSSNEEDLYSRIVQLSSSDTESTISSISSLEDTLADISESGVSTEESIPRGVGPPTYPMMASGSGGSGASRNHERVPSPHLPSRKRRKLSDLIKKKKEGLKDNFHRNRSRLTSSSDSSSEEESHGVAAEIREQVKSPVFENYPVDVQNMMRKKQLALKDSFVKLKRLRTLRNQILNSDEDTEISVATKVMEKKEYLKDDKSTDKDKKSLHHKSKKHMESSTLGPYVHEMCHMFEAGSSSEHQVCSVQNRVASSTTTKCESTDNTNSFENETSQCLEIDMNKQTNIDRQFDNWSQRKWKPLGSISHSFHISSCDSKMNINNTESAVADLIKTNYTGECRLLEDKMSIHYNEKSRSENSINGILDDEKFLATDMVKCGQNESKMPEYKQTLFDTEMTKFKNSESGISTDNKPANLSFLPEFKNNNCQIVKEKPDHGMNTSDTSKLGIYEDIKQLHDVDTPQYELSQDRIVDNTGLPKEINMIENSDNTYTARYKNVEDQLSITLPITVNCDRTAEPSVTSSELDYFCDSTPSCSSVCGSGLSETIESNQDLSEVTRAAWSEFKKRKSKPEHSKKHYRSHKH